MSNYPHHNPSGAGYPYGGPPPSQPYSSAPYGAQHSQGPPPPNQPSPYAPVSTPYSAPSAPPGPGAPPNQSYGGYPPAPYGTPFASLMPSAFPPGTDPSVIACFQVADQDGSGFIDDKELQRALSSYNQSFGLRTVHLLMYLFTNTNTRKIVLSGKKRGADGKDAARGSKKLRAAGRSASPAERGQQFELTGPAAADSSLPTSSSPHKPAEIVYLSGGEARPAGPLVQLEDLPFPENIGRVARWLEEGVKRMSAEYEDENDRYSEQLTAAKARLGKAKDEVKAVAAKTAEAELKAEKARAEVERLKAELKAAGDGQGDALRAYTQRLLLSERFSGLANELAGLINGNAVVDALEEVAKDFPNLDVSKYGYERLEGAALFSRYAEVIRDHLGQLPILNELASSPGLLTAEQISACSADRDPELDAAFDALPVEMEVDEEEQEK